MLLRSSAGPLGAASAPRGHTAAPRYRRGARVPLGDHLRLAVHQPISRRYQYDFPLITFLYRLAMNLDRRRSQGNSG
jgi:hypothetical protein